MKNKKQTLNGNKSLPFRDDIYREQPERITTYEPQVKKIVAYEKKKHAAEVILTLAHRMPKATPDKAGLLYLAGDKSLRQLAEESGVSPQTILNRATRFRKGLEALQFDT